MGFHFRKPLGGSVSDRPNGSKNGGNGPRGSGLSYSELIDLRKSEIPVQPGRKRGPIFRRGFVVALGGLLLLALACVAIWFALYRAPGPAASAANRNIGVVTASKLNCRAQPSATSPVVGIAVRGDKVVVLNTSGFWQRVRLRGADCWVSVEYVRLAGG